MYREEARAWSELVMRCREVDFDLGCEDLGEWKMGEEGGKGSGGLRS